MSAALADGEALLQRVESETQEKDGQQVYQGKDPWWEKDVSDLVTNVSKFFSLNPRLRL